MPPNQYPFPPAASTKTQALKLDDLVKWYVEQSYSIVPSVVSTGADAGLSVGDSLIGKLAYWSGSAWKLIDAADVITATSKLAVICETRKIVADVAVSTAIGTLPLLELGPALVQKKHIDYAGKTPATVDQALLDVARIRVVDETGVEFTFES